MIKKEILLYRYRYFIVYIKAVYMKFIKILQKMFKLDLKREIMSQIDHFLKEKTEK